ncbi:MAG: hypothetical protein NTY02_20385 [Acidobacteria bacterium]|nr:hypothetical protein [Acidobacteriota bacterium]
MSDPIDQAINRAAEPQPERQQFNINLPTGGVAVLNVPSPFAAPDGLALIAAIAGAFVKPVQPAQPDPRSRILVPRN